ncbi:MAG TPA: hypothetical protein VM100_02830 [Longimicrobiales bacterium]|nr:hypothetical protein [Longimicrobiales bacterium]
MILLLFAGAGCSELVSNSESIQVALPSQEELIGLVRAVNDVATRISPSLSNPTNGPRLRSSLQSLAAALNAADGPAAAKAVDEARAALTAYLQASDLSQSETPDLSVVDLALTRVNGLLQRPCSRNNSRLPLSTQNNCLVN